MTKPFDDGGVESVYNFWLGLIPQFFSQIGVSLPAGGKAAPAHASDAAHASDWLGPWAATMPFLAGMMGKSADGGAAPTAAQAMFAPWGAMLAPYPSAPGKADSAATSPLGAVDMFGAWAAALPFIPGASGVPGSIGHGAATAATQPFQAAQQAWLDFVMQMGGASPQSFMTGLDRTFGGLFDALGFGPMRKLQAASQDLAAASLAQNQSRAAYAMLVQGAFASGLERLMMQLGKMADAGERVESVLTLLRMWAVHTEQAVHEVLQSKQGLAATASLTRAGLSHRKKLQHAAAIVADSLDMATRRELDEVYREIHELKRELRALRAPAPAQLAAVTRPRSRANKRKAKP
jgi:Poly(R)-hydroxyalkanoic acid synthase subunit (PHA_synth_III_E)